MKTRAAYDKTVTNFADLCAQLARVRAKRFGKRTFKFYCADHLDVFELGKAFGLVFDDDNHLVLPVTMSPAATIRLFDSKGEEIQRSRFVSIFAHHPLCKCQGCGEPLPLLTGILLELAGPLVIMHEYVVQSTEEADRSADADILGELGYA